MASFIKTFKAVIFCIMLSPVLSGNLRAPGSNKQSDSDHHHDGLIEKRQLQKREVYCDTPFADPSLCANHTKTNAPQPCPKVSALDASHFDLNKFIEKSWYVQQQQMDPDQSQDQKLHCIVATYNMDPGSDIIEVKNYGNKNHVNGTHVVNGPLFASNDLVWDPPSMLDSICAKQHKAGIIAMAPCSWGINAVAAPYWVLALAVARDYSWAIVSGGKLDQPYPNQHTNGHYAYDGPTVCTTKNGSAFGSGLWLLTRDQVPHNGEIPTMENTLEQLGVYTGFLQTVTQVGCGYEGATLKK